MAATTTPPPPPPPPPPFPPPRQFLRRKEQLSRPPAPLVKHKSWSADVHREEAWLRRKGNNARRDQRSKSVTDEDMEELMACIELGFGFSSPEPDPRLSNTFPALDLYYAVNRQYQKASSSSDCDTPPSPPDGSPMRLFEPGDDPKEVKTRLRQWAQVVACSVRHC